jgi:hypothetical protein
MWPFNIFITLAIPIGGGLWWLAFNRRKTYDKLFLPLIILVGVVFILSIVWDLSNYATMSVLVPYIELGKVNDAEVAVYNVKIFSGLFLLNCIITCGYLCFLQRFVASENKNSESGNEKSPSLLQRFMELGNKKPLHKKPFQKKTLDKMPLKKRRKNKRGGYKRKR